MPAWVLNHNFLNNFDTVIRDKETSHIVVSLFVYGFCFSWKQRGTLLWHVRVIQTQHFKLRRCSRVRAGFMGGTASGIAKSEFFLARSPYVAGSKGRKAHLCVSLKHFHPHALKATINAELFENCGSVRRSVRVFVVCVCVAMCLYYHPHFLIFHYSWLTCCASVNPS